MNAPHPVPTISEIKVDIAQQGSPRVTIEWIDRAGEQLRDTRVGRSAQFIINDLAAATLLGEDCRNAYLVGLIRGITLERRG